MQIRVETEQLQEISDGLQVKKEGFETLVTEMKGLVDRIPDAWAEKLQRHTSDNLKSYNQPSIMLQN